MIYDDTQGKPESSCTHDCSTCSANCPSKDKQSLLEKPHELSNVKKVIGVVSGKGGVGKSIVTSMLSVLMNRRGYSAAILDADITGPSIPKAFAVKGDVNVAPLAAFERVFFYLVSGGREILAVTAVDGEKTRAWAVIYLDEGFLRRASHNKAHYRIGGIVAHIANSGFEIYILFVNVKSCGENVVPACGTAVNSVLYLPICGSVVLGKVPFIRGEIVGVTNGIGNVYYLAPIIYTHYKSAFFHGYDHSFLTIMEVLLYLYIIFSGFSSVLGTDQICCL